MGVFRDAMAEAMALRGFALIGKREMEDEAQRVTAIRWDLLAAATVFGMLVAFSPIAMSFELYSAIYRDGVWSGTFTQDPSYPSRATLIVLGLLGAVSTAAIAWAAARRGMSSPSAAVQVSIALACWALGWRSYPYWVNGIFQGSDMASGGMFDPKALPPMSWVGELWRLPTLLLYPVAFVGSLALIARAAWVIRSTSGRRAWPWAVVFCSLVTLASMIYCPVYGVWILD